MVGHLGEGRIIKIGEGLVGCWSFGVLGEGGHVEPSTPKISCHDFLSGGLIRSSIKPSSQESTGDAGKLICSLILDKYRSRRLIL